MTRTRASISARAVVIVAHSPFTNPLSAARSGDTSQNISGISSASHDSHLVIPPAVWCSVMRYVVRTKGKSGSSNARW